VPGQLPHGAGVPPIGAEVLCAKWHAWLAMLLVPLALLASRGAYAQTRQIQVGFARPYFDAHRNRHIARELQAHRCRLVVNDCGGVDLGHIPVALGDLVPGAHRRRWRWRYRTCGEHMPSASAAVGNHVVASELVHVLRCGEG
jgi:hypothetical protein